MIALGLRAPTFAIAIEAWYGGRVRSRWTGSEEEVGQALGRLLLESADPVSAQALEAMHNLVRHGDAAAALESFCAELRQQGALPPPTIRESVRSLARIMQIDPPSCVGLLPSSGFVETWAREMRALLVELRAQDFGYEISANELGSPAAGIPDSVPPALSTMYAAFDGLSMPDVHNGYFIHPVASVASAMEREPTRISSAPHRRIHVFGSDGGGGRFALRLDDGVVFHVPGECAVEDGTFIERDPVRARQVAGDWIQLLELIKRDLKAFVEAKQHHPFITN